MSGDLVTTLSAFTEEKSFRGKGPLSVALVVTECARNSGLPLDPEALVTERRGQVLGLGRSAVQTILQRHGIARVLASEGGRTSRGSMGNVRDYVAFLNGLAERGEAGLETPKMDGYETAQRLRQLSIGRDVRLIALTGWGQREDRRHTRSAGFDEHLTKPVDISTLERTLSVLI